MKDILKFLKLWTVGLLTILSIFVAGYFLIKFGIYIEANFSEAFNQASESIEIYLINFFDISTHNYVIRLILKILSPFLLLFSPIFAIGLVILFIAGPFCIGYAIQENKKIYTS